MSVRTFEFFISQRFDASSMHAFGCIASGTASFDGVLMQIVGQPAQIAVTYKGVAGQVPEWIRFVNHQLKSNLLDDKKCTGKKLTMFECVSSHRRCHSPANGYCYRTTITSLGYANL